MAPTAATRQPILLNLRVLPVARKAGSPPVTHWIASTSDVARDGGIIEAGGWQVDEFLRAHPSILWCHDYQGLPLGSARKAWVDGDDLHFHMQFADHEFAKTVERMVLSDPPHIRACSVGFDILTDRKPTSEERDRGAHWVATKTRLNEISLVPVPADPGAVFVGSRMRRSDADVIRRRFHLPYWEVVAKSIERNAMKREVKTTDDGLLVAELRPAADFVEDSFKSMAWPDAEGVSAVTGILVEEVDVEAIQGLEFDAESFDAETAQAWLDENEGALLEWRNSDAEINDQLDGDGTEPGGEQDADKGLSRDQVRAVVEKVREAAITLGEAADELETLVEGDDETLDEGGEHAAAIAEMREQIDSLTRRLQELAGVTGSDDDLAARPDGSPDVADSYGLLDEANKAYAGS